MPIVVQYGPVADALQAAAIAGRGQGFNLQANRDMQALQMQNQMQSEIDRNNATEMQNAMAYQQNASLEQYRQQTLAQQAAQQHALDALRAQSQTFNEQNAMALQQNRNDSLAQRQSQFDEAQQTRQQQADALAKLREAQTNRLNNPPQNSNQAIQANGMVLRSMDQQAGLMARQLQSLQAAFGKASDPYTGDKAQAAAIQDQINGIKFSLDGIDPATGKKSGLGLNDKREALRDTIQKLGPKLRSGATLTPSQEGGFDLNNEDPNSEGLDNPEDPLYQVNNPPPPPGMSYGTMPTQPSPGVMPAQPAMPAYGAQPAAGQGEKGPATPGLTFQIGQAFAQKLGLSQSDPQVTQATIQYLQSQGYTPPLIH